MRRLGDEGGSVAVLAALMMVLFAGLAALGVDVARAYARVQQLQQAASSAALAGAELLPGDPTGAQQTAVQYGVENGVPQGGIATEVSPDGTTMEVTAAAPFDWTFARVLGLGSLRLQGEAEAQVQALAGAQGSQPWGVPQQGFQVGQTYAVKVWQGTNGNFYPLALGGNGAAQYEQNVMYGYPDRLDVGQLVWTETGNMAGPTRDGLNYRLQQDPDATWDHVSVDSPRLLTLPIVSPPQNGKSQVQVLAFGVFFLQGFDGSGDVLAVFENARELGQGCALGSPGCVDDGAYTVRLVQ